MKEPKEHQFVIFLERLRDSKDRAALARLRRGLGKKMGTPQMFPYVVPFLYESMGKREQEHYFLVASLFALHPEASSKGTSLGKVFKRMSDGSESIEKRFMNLLSADPADIGGHLRHAVSLAKNKTIPIDYHQLIYDLKYWGHQDRFIQFKWARDFWGKTKEQENDNSTLKGGEE